MTEDEDVILISRLLDDELTTAEATQLKKRLLKEPDLRELYDAMAQDQVVLAELIAKIDQEPVPDRLSTNLESTDLGAYRPWAASVAAVLVTAVATLYVFNHQSGPSLANLLEHMPTGESASFQEGRLSIVATFRSESAWCREYVTNIERGVACREGDSWATVVRQAVKKAPGENIFNAAGGQSLVQDYVLEHIKGQPLSASEESEVLGKW